MIPAFFVTFLISGLWHGAAWTFVLWGALQAFGLSVHYLWDEWYKGLCRRDRTWVKRRQRPGYRIAAWALTQGFFVLTLVPFRATSLATSAAYARGLLPGAGAEGLSLMNPQLLAALGIVVGYQLAPYGFFASLWHRFQSLPPLVRGLAYGLAIAFLLIMTPQGSGTFIYAQY